MAAGLEKGRGRWPRGALGRPRVVRGAQTQCRAWRPRLYFSLGSVPCTEASRRTHNPRLDSGLTLGPAPAQDSGPGLGNGRCGSGRGLSVRN